MRSLMGTRIRERRRAKKISQTALAAKAGISTSYMNLIEHNHRAIAGRTLLAIAEGLDVDPAELSEGADHALVALLQEAVDSLHDDKAEMNRVEEFIGRFPGWAKLGAQLYEKSQLQGEELQVLSDRLGRDPFFSEAMHLMLSNVTVLQSTSEILANNDDIEESQLKKFLSNMQTESTRLTDTIVKLLSYFDESNNIQSQKYSQNTQSKLEAFWDSHHFYIKELERSDVFGSQEIGKISKAWNFKTSGETEAAEQSLQRYHRIAKILPIDNFIQLAKQKSYNPIALAKAFRCSLHDVFFRLAHLPTSDEDISLPIFGLIECDGSGGVLFRKPLKNLSLPRKSSACPLWPLYRATSQPMQPVRAIIETPTGENFLTYSLAEWSENANYEMPGTVKSAMLFTADHHSFISVTERRSFASVKVGLNCEVCPRENCGARRAKSLLSQ